MLHNNNFETNHDTIIINTKIEADQLYHKYIYSNINNKKQNLILKLLSAINNIKSMIMAINDIIVLIIIYYTKSYLIYLND